MRTGDAHRRADERQPDVFYRAYYLGYNVRAVGNNDSDYIQGIKGVLTCVYTGVRRP